jgi:hypothetical protein
MKYLMVTGFLMVGACGPLTIDGKLSADPDGSEGDTAASSDDTGGTPQDADGDGHWTPADCDDGDSSVYPGAAERCDGRDDDCDGLIDDEAVDAELFFIDLDGDGYGAEEVYACAAPESGLTQGGDCVDDDPAVNPGMDEVCGDGLDNDCDGGPGPCQLGGLVSAAAATGTITGTEPEDQVGQFVNPVGDVTGDGLDDLLIGIPASDERTTNAGLVVVMDGPHTGERTTSEAWARLLGESIGDAAGQSIAAAGYLNDDILADVIIGAPGANGLGSDAGRAYVVLGGMSASSGLDSAQAIFLGEAEGDQAGYSVIRAGDLDGDGQAELAIAAPWASYPAAESGAVYIVDSHTAGTHNLATASARLTGSSTGEQAGRSLEPGGDLNGDGYDNLLVGAPYHGGSSTGLQSGRVYILTSSTADGPLGEQSLVITGEEANAFVGQDICAPGDLDGDGQVDLILSSGNADSAGVDSGEVYVFYGPISSDLSILEADVVIHGEGSFDFAGRTIGSARDFNQDGLADFLVGAPGDDFGDINAGAAYLVSGSATGMVDLSTAPTKIYAEDADAQMGLQLGSAGDADGDGWPDIYVGAPYVDHPEINAGGIYVFAGSSGM